MTPEEIERRVRILLSTQSALLGAIVPNLREVFVDWDKTKIKFYFVFDETFSEDFHEEMECVATEVGADFPEDTVETHYLSIQTSERVPHMGKACVFARKDYY